MSALGNEFRTAREARGLALSDVAEKIHIRSVYLSGIENEDWSSIGAPVYVRGFIRTYARCLGLDGEAAVAAFNESVPAEKTVQAAAPLRDDRERSGPSPWAVLGIVVALVLCGFVGFEWWSFSRTNGAGAVAQATPAAAASAAPASAAAAPEPTAAPAVLHHALAVHLTQRSWLRVTVDGKTIVEGIFPAGTDRTFSGNVADVRVGNAGGVRITVDGRPPTTLGKDGDVAEQRFIL